MRLFKVTYILFALLLVNKVKSQEKPNVLFISVDDLNDYTNCMDGSINAITPNIDKLAEQGTLFTNAHCQAPICGPSRASILTGMYPHNTGIYLMIHDKLIKRANDRAANAIFMPDFFKSQGYKTMGVGKVFHEGDKAQCFDEYGGRFDWFGPFPEERLNYDMRKLPNKTGYTSTDWGAYPEHDSLLTDYKSANWAVNKLNEKHDAPFFLAVGFIRPHVPWYVPQKWYDMFPTNKIVTPPYNKNDYNDIPKMAKTVTEVPMMPTTVELIEWGQWKDALQGYLASAAFVDAQIGKVLNALEQSDYAGNTIVVLWSDHGYHLGEKNRFAKMSLWKQDTRVPLIFRVPGQTGGQNCNAPVGLIDIYPTLLELCNLPDYKMGEGKSLVPLLNNVEKEWSSAAITFYGKGNVSVSSKKFRLIRYEDGSQELYNIVSDPYEWNNLANDTEYATVLETLEKHIPVKQMPLSKHSRYNINSYFKNKSIKK